MLRPEKRLRRTGVFAQQTERITKASVVVNPSTTVRIPWAGVGRFWKRRIQSAPRRSPTPSVLDDASWHAAAISL